MFAGSGETKAEIGKCTAFVSSDEAYAGGDIVILRARGVCVTFLSYLLNTPRVQALKASRGQGDAVVHISSAALAEIEVSMPGLDEQTAIAETLSEMDGSIDLLQTKLDKAMEIKQGMMQALLTGRIRLVKPASNVIPLPTKPAATKPTRAQSAHNWQINEAVVIGVLAQQFGSEKMPLGRKRRVKLHVPAAPPCRRPGRGLPEEGRRPLRSKHQVQGPRADCAEERLRAGAAQ